MSGARRGTDSSEELLGELVESMGRRARVGSVDDLTQINALNGGPAI